MLKEGFGLRRIDGLDHGRGRDRAARLLAVSSGPCLPASLESRLTLPLIAAPMFLVSGPALVKAACRAGVIGSFPTANCRTVEELDAWLADDQARADETGAPRRSART